jgi:hypothetical protein
VWSPPGARSAWARHSAAFVRLHAVARGHRVFADLAGLTAVTVEAEHQMCCGIPRCPGRGVARRQDGQPRLFVRSARQVRSLLPWRAVDCSSG